MASAHRVAVGGWFTRPADRQVERRGFPNPVARSPRATDRGGRIAAGVDLPQLQGLGLESYVLRHPIVKELSKYPNPVELTVELRLVAPDTVDAVLAQIIAMPGLRRLYLKGHEQLDHGN